MVNSDDYRRAGVPTSLLGCSWNNWKMAEIRAVLSHYGRESRRRVSKLELMGLLHGVVQDQALTRHDKSRILRAYRKGEWLQRPYSITRALSLTRPIDPAEVANRNNSKEEETFSEYSGTNSQECVVCFDVLNARNFPSREITSSCQHSPDVCTQCLTNSIATQFVENYWNHILCPNCGKPLDYHDVKAFADKETFEKYERLTLEAFLNTGHFQQCHAPGCSSGQQCFPENDSFIICRDCGGRTCIRCDVLWHADETCEEYTAREQNVKRARNAQEMASAEYLRSETKKCPGCGAPTQKIEGCDHITCYRCEHEYCWRIADITVTNFLPWNGRVEDEDEDGDEHEEEDEL